MLKDSLENMENIYTDLSLDSIGAKHLSMTTSVSFNEMFSYVVELPISAYWTTEAKLTKSNEVNNLMD